MPDVILQKNLKKLENHKNCSKNSKKHFFTKGTENRLSCDDFWTFVGVRPPKEWPGRFQNDPKLGAFPPNLGSFWDLPKNFLEL